jgi:malonate decarboxylase beta subunit
MGVADALVDDDIQQVADAIRGFIKKGVPPVPRSSQVALYRSRIAALDTSRQWDPKELRANWGIGGSEKEK